MANSDRKESISLGDKLKVEFGLSRWLRYSYSGFTIILLLHECFGKDQFLKNVQQSLGSVLSLVAVIVIGAGVYTFHRRLIIPIHHLWAIFIHRLFEYFSKNTKERNKSMNPAVWLSTLCETTDNNSKTSIFTFKNFSSLWKGIIAYSYLRKTDVFENTNDLNIQHAELGLLIMTGEALIVAGICKPDLYLLLFGLGLFMLFSVIPDIVLHTLECRELRNNYNAVVKELNKVGLSTTHYIDQPDNDVDKQEAKLKEVYRNLLDIILFMNKYDPEGRKLLLIAEKIKSFIQRNGQ